MSRSGVVNAPARRTRGWRALLRSANRNGCRSTARTPHRADFSARSAAAIKEVGPVGLEPADAGAERHLQPLEHAAALRVDAAEFARVAFPGAVPQLAVD